MGVRSIHKTSRRSYIKGVGGSIAAVGLAGCTSLGGGGGEVDSITYWDTFNVQSQSARETVENLVSRFEDETGVTVQTNLSGFGQMAFGEWITSFKEGEYPVIFTGDQIAAGQFEEGGFIEPFGSWSDQLSDDVRDGISWIQDGPIQEATKWMDQHPFMEQEIYTFPVGLVPQEPVTVRADHMREAGLDPDDELPLQSYDHLVEVATTLMEDGPGDWGFQLHGHAFDWYTFIEPYTDALGAHIGEAGYFSEDYRAVNYDSDTWIKAITDAIELYTEHGVSGPQTPSIPDEETVPLFLEGRVSMSPMEPMNWPTYIDQAPDLMEAGDIRFGQFWEEPSGVNNAMLTYGLAITTPPEGADEDEWAQKQELAIQFAEMWFEEATQSELFRATGFIPARQDLWEQNAANLPYGDASRAFETLTDMALNSTRGIQTSFPMYLLGSSDLGSNMARGYNEELTPEEVCVQSAELSNNVLDGYWSSI